MMEAAQKAEGRKAAKPGERKSNENDSDEELEPPSPIHIAPEGALVPDFDFPDPQELRRIESDTQNRLKAILEVAGVTGLSQIDARTFQDPEILRKLTNSVSTALDEAATALTRMKSEKQSYEAFLRGANQAPSPTSSTPSTLHQSSATTLAKATSTASHRELPGGAQPHPHQPHPQPQSQPHPHQQQQQQQQQQQAQDSMQAVQRLIQGQGLHEATEDGDSLLSLACSAGYYELAEVLLRMRASVEDRGVKGDSTPLMEAASGGYADIVKLLIDHGANVNAKSSVGNTALTYACCGGYEDVVKILLEAGADVEHQNENGHTPLMEAASCGHVGVAKLLLEYGANINTHSNEFKESALTLACYKGHLEMVKFLLGAGADQEHKTDEMHTALMEASMDGHVDVARLLLDHGAQVNMPVDSFESPLTLAACGGHYELAALLLSRGADLEEVNDEGYTPLMEAAREGHEDVVTLLVDHGANVNAQTEETQETALTLACCGGFLEVTQYLIEHGADIELGASTPLMEAAQEGHVDIVKFLIERGASIHAETNTMDTALTYACANGHTIIADILLQCGAEMEHESEGGRTPLMKAARAGHLQTVQFLISKGADVNRSTTANDHTVLSLACAGGHVSVVQYLLMQGGDPSYMLRDCSTMLIEAARGGHTAVVNLVLRQPKITNPLPAAPTASRSHKNAAEPGHPSSQEGRKIATSRKLAQQHFQQQQHQDIPPAQANNSDAMQSQSAMVGNNHAQVSDAEQQLLMRAADGAERTESSVSGSSVHNCLLPERGSQKAESAGAGVPESAAQVSEPGAGGVTKPEGGGAKRPKISSGDSQEHESSTAGVHQESSATAHTTGAAPPPQAAGIIAGQSQQLLRLHQCAQMVTPDVAAQYAADSSTALKNIQRLTASVGAAGSFHGAHPHPHPHPGEVGVTADDIIQGHVTAEDIISQYWMQHHHHHHAALQQSNGSEGAGLPSSGASDIAKASLENAQSLFSAGNFGRELPLSSQSVSPSFVLPQFHAGSAGTFPNPSAQPRQQGNELALPTAPESNSSGLPPNPGISRLIPHLEAIAGSLQQNPSLLDSQYLAATLAQSQMLPGLAHNDSGSTQALPSLEAAQAVSVDRKHLPDSEEMTKFLSGMETQNGLPPESHTQPIYTTDLQTLKQVSPKAHSSNSDSYDAQGFDVDMLQNRPRSLSASFLLDGNFPLDIPPPSDLIPEHLSSMLPAGYVGSLENESYPTSEEEEEEAEEEESDSSYLAQDLSALPPGSFEPAIDIDQQTDSNHDTALTLAAAGGHDELVELLMANGANIEHRDKKGCTPLVLAASAGHAVTVAILLDHNADIEAQTDRTKDTALSLACSGGRQEVVELLLAKGANFEHRNVSDYTPLSLAASGGYVNIIKLLLRAGADINSRTGSKLGISPLMLAAMNGHSSTVKLLLDMGSDINAQIETNRNTALTLACFQGRHEVVNLLVERQANVEHRAKTGLTPLMEAASGGYHEVGKVLIFKGADVNAAPVPSSRDTALTIAADKGHSKFVALILRHGAHVDVKNKKGNSPLWLACNGGHLEVVRLLIEQGADVDSQDNRKVSCLMAAFRKGHCKVVKELVEHVSQFPSDAELTRYVNTLSDKELLKKCQRCMDVIMRAKDRQAAEANKNASILLHEIDLERKHEEDRKAAAARKRAKRKRQKEKKQAQKAKGNAGDSPPEGDQGDDAAIVGDDVAEEVDDVIEDTSPGSGGERLSSTHRVAEPYSREVLGPSAANTKRRNMEDRGDSESGSVGTCTRIRAPAKSRTLNSKTSNQISPPSSASSLGSPMTTITLSPLGTVAVATMTTPTTSPRKGKSKEDGWKEVGRRTKKLGIPSSIFSQVVGKGCCHLSAIRHATNTHIEVDKLNRQSPTRTITVRGSTEAIKQVQHYVSLLIKDPTRDLNHLLLKQSAHLLMKQSTHNTRSHPAPHELPRVSPVDAFEDSGSLAVSRTSTAAASLSITVTTTAGVTLAAKAVYKKSGSFSGSSGIGSGTVSTSATVSTGARNPGVSSQSSGRGRTSSVSSEKKAQSLQSTTSEQRGDDTVTTTSTRIVTTSVVADTHTLMKHSAPPPTPTTSSAVRRLFTSSSSQTAATQATVVVTATQTVSYPPKVSAAATHVHPANPRNPASVTVTPAVTVRPSIIPSTVVSSLGKQSAASSTAPRIPETYSRPATTETQPKAVSVAKSSAPVGGTLTYSSVIGSQDLQPPLGAIEQPLQQIMKTPTILQEPATQLTKPKKKSTYSDAVGKKLSLSDPSPSKLGPFSMGGGAVMGQLPAPPPQFPPVQQQQQQQQQPKLNLAPGSRPLMNDVGDKPYSQHPDKRKWSDHPHMLEKPLDFCQSFEEDDQIMSPLVQNLGPIGPPSRMAKQPQGIKNSSSFSPGGSRPKTSPTGVVNTSPQRNEHSPVAKSPLLGTAPPGLLPPPDKGLYSTAFRPIQLQPSDFPQGDCSGLQTLMPTPLRNPRPPLLATPPGFAHTFLPQGLHQSPLLPKQGQKPTSPIPNLSPEKGSLSPSKSPPHHPLKGFNPNAPTFIPMGLQNMQRPAKPSTSSILGAPPPPPSKFGSFVPGPPGGSILGTAPQLATSVYGTTRMISPPTIFTSQNSQPVTQSSILGQPPSAPLAPQMFAPPPPGPPGPPGGPAPSLAQQSFPNLSSRQGQVLGYGQQYEGNPPSAGLIQPPQFLIPFPSNQSMNGQPPQGFGTSMKDAFSGGLEPSLLTMNTGQPPLSQVTSASVSSGGGDFSKFGMPLMDGGGVDMQQGSSHGSLILAVSGASPFNAASKAPPLGSGGSGGTLMNPFNISLGHQLGSMPPVPIPHQEGSKGDRKDPSSDLTHSPVIDGFPPGQPFASYLQAVQLPTSSSGSMMPAGVFPTPESGSSPTSESQSQGSDGLLPIGTERAHKRSSSLPGSSAFPVIAAPGINPTNVWSYSGNPTSSEDSDWSKQVGVSDSGDWPSLASSVGSDIINPGGDITITSQDNLELVLEKLGLTTYHQLFQKNEIDLDALFLMSGKDFSEIGLPKGPRNKLLKAIGRLSEEGTLSLQDEESLVSMATEQPSKGVASQEGSDPDEQPAMLPSNQQPDTSQ